MKTVFWATVFWLVFFGLAVLAFWTRMPSEEIASINKFLIKNRGVVISLGTVALVSFVGIYTTFLTNYAANRREKYSRKIEAELQIARFRQSWIDRLRDELAGIQIIIDHAILTDSDVDYEKLIPAFNRVFLQLNPDEKEPELFRDLMVETTSLFREIDNHEVQEEDSKKLIRISRDLRDCSSRILRSEWRRLKDDLKHAQGIEL